MVSNFLAKMVAIFLIFIAPIQGLIWLITFAVGFDTIFAIYVSIKQKGIKSFTSTKLFNIVVKTFFYMGSIVLAFLMDKFIFEGNVQGIPYLVSKLITCLWLYIEIKSIDETSMKLGNKSLWVQLRELIRKGKDFKKDISE
jgi:hypothetical protein